MLFKQKVIYWYIMINLQYQNQVLFFQYRQTLFTRRLLSITVGHYVDAKSLSVCVYVGGEGTQVLM